MPVINMRWWKGKVFCHWVYENCKSRKNVAACFSRDHPQDTDCSLTRGSKTDYFTFRIAGVDAKLRLKLVQWLFCPGQNGERERIPALEALEIRNARNWGSVCFFFVVVTFSNHVSDCTKVCSHHSSRTNRSPSFVNCRKSRKDPCAKQRHLFKSDIKRLFYMGKDAFLRWIMVLSGSPTAILKYSFGWIGNGWRQ